MKWIIFILLIALALRLISLNQSFWLDEAITAIAIRENNLWDLVTKYSVGDLHPPLHYILLWFWGRIFSFSEIALRFPSVIFGVGTVWLTFLIGKELLSKRVGLIAGLLLALAPLHVYYSQEARMYSMATFAATLSFYFLIRLTKQKRWSWLGLFLANILVFYTDYLIYLIIPAQIIYVLMCPYMERLRLIKPYSKILLLSLITLIIWEPVFLVQLASGTNTVATLSGWANVVGGASFKDLALIPIKTFIGRISFENKILYGLIIGFLSLIYALITWYGIKRFDKSINLLLLWLIVPVALAFVISLFIPVLSYFRLIFILPAFYLLIAKGIDELLRTKVTPGRLMLLVMCLASLICLVIYYTNPKFQREDWKGLVNWVKENNAQVILENNDIFAPINYYTTDNSKFQPGLKKIPASSKDDINELSTDDIYLLQYLVDITDPNRFLEKGLIAKGFIKKETINFNGVGFVEHFSR